MTFTFNFVTSMQHFAHHGLHQAYSFAFIMPQVLVSNELLSSLDVVSLFTNVPLQLATEVAQCRLRGDADLKDHTGLSVEEVMKFLEFCLSATFFSVCGGIYQQTFGTAMGSPVSVSVANVMEDVEERALATTDVPLKYWKHYEVDTCTALPASNWILCSFTPTMTVTNVQCSTVLK